MDENPYEAPKSAGEDRLDSPILREVVVAWEKLRILYNGILLVPGMVMLGIAANQSFLPIEGLMAAAFMVAAGANVAFFLGPLAEIYLRGFLLRDAPIGRGRWLIFGAGLVVSAGVFVVAAMGLIAAN